ncbi:MAG: carboxypeptidase-like regulatory domain-containing protein [Bacteroidales bacterium]|nr:carboxypeptidase-like regulatory domain-containing protein [Bacteroidales bacterium]
MLSFNGFIFKKFSAIALFILLATVQEAACQVSILDSAFTFRAGLIKTGNALNLITRQTGYNFTYDSRLINPDNKIEMIFSNEKLNIILGKILQNDTLVFSVIDKYIIISKAYQSPVVLTDSIPAGETNYISGFIVDDETFDPLPFASIGLKNIGRGTVTNNNGEFVLNITPDCLNDTIYVSYLGYLGREIPVKQSLGNNFTIIMRREFISIPEIIIRTKVPQEVIYKTLAAIHDNYGNTPALLTGFYREGVMKKEELQVYSEAVLQIYKSAYTATLLGDQVKVYKSRKIENADPGDTLAVRLKAGISTCLELDGAKHIFDFIARESMDEYIYRITDIVSFDQEAAYVIDFEQKEGVESPLYRGTIYINTDDFAILHADFELHPKYLHKMKESFISSSSRGFNTWPVTVKYSVSYRKVNNRYFLNHVRGDLVFTSKRRKKLFSSQFNVFFELAITGMNINNVNRFDREELAPVHSVFSKTITSYDTRFWGNQDFLKPEDNLLQALKNMKVKLLEFSE